MIVNPEEKRRFRTVKPSWKPPAVQQCKLILRTLRMSDGQHIFHRARTETHRSTKSGATFAREKAWE